MSTGDIIFVPPVIHRTFCSFNTDNWPWGEQNCSLIFGSWTYSEKDINLIAYDVNGAGGEFDIKYFVNPRVRLFFQIHKIWHGPYNQWKKELQAQVSQ